MLQGRWVSEGAGCLRLRFCGVSWCRRGSVWLDRVQAEIDGAGEAGRVIAGRCRLAWLTAVGHVDGR